MYQRLPIEEIPTMSINKKPVEAISTNPRINQLFYVDFGSKLIETYFSIAKFGYSFIMQS